MNHMQSVNSWPSYECVTYQDNPYPLPSNLGHFDFSEHVLPLNWEYELPMQDGIFEAMPLMESVEMNSLHVYDSNIHSTTDLQVADNRLPDLGTDFELINDMFSGFEPEKPKPLMLTENGESQNEKKIKIRRCRSSEEMSNKMLLSRETISQYFYMPIAQAAKELKVGITHLKKRCRELGISRWPHRKLCSLQNLIKSVQELGTERGTQEGEEKLKHAIEILENEKRLLEEHPDAKLMDKTKRLRQACFKANYKKRKFMRTLDSHSFSLGF